jgi:pimeloyl-ACP methyl ester carboxylesterase/GNAT superfamily N-acetyltransferase
VSLPTFRSDRVKLHYEDLGEGEPVLLLHGFTSSFAGTWQRTGWVDPLTSSGRRVNGLDFPSHGDSDPVYDPRRCKPTRLSADVVALLDRLRLDRADLVGFSMGAGIALRVAMTHPSRVARLVLGGIGDAALNGLHDPQQVARVAAAFVLEPGAEVDDPVAARIRRNAELAGGNLRVLLPFLQGDGWPGGLDELRPVDAPILLFVAEAEQYMAKTHEIRRWLGHAEVLRLEGDHHTVLRDDGLKHRVLAFLARRTSLRMPGDDDESLQIRRYAASDEETVWRLHVDGLDQFGANAGEGPWDDDLHQIEDAYLRDGELLVGEVRGEVVAMGALRAASADVGELKRVRVAHPFQGRGIGEAISRALLDRAEELGFRRVILDTTTRQVPAQRLYEKLGFRETHRRLGHTGLELIFYERQLG